MAKLNSNADCVKLVKEILDDDCHDPADAMIEMGKTLTKIGEVLKGKTISDGRNIIAAVQLLL
jgi:hypothetical protein